MWCCTSKGARLDPIVGRSWVQQPHDGAVRTDGSVLSTLITEAWFFATGAMHCCRSTLGRCTVDGTNPDGILRRLFPPSTHRLGSVRTALCPPSFRRTMTSVDVLPRVWTNQHSDRHPLVISDPLLRSFASLPLLRSQGILFPTLPPHWWVQPGLLPSGEPGMDPWTERKKDKRRVE